jgi:hypothetical protein
MQFETQACTILFLYQNHSGHHPRFETYTNPFPCHRAKPKTYLPFPPPKRYLWQSGRRTRNYVFSFNVQGSSNQGTSKQKHSFFSAIQFSSVYNTTENEDEPRHHHTPQRVCPIFPWSHPPWPKSMVPWIPMSPLQAPSGQVCACCGWFPCLGCRNGTN